MWGNSLKSLYASASDSAKAAFNSATRATLAATEKLEESARAAYSYSKAKVRESADYVEGKVDDAVRYTKDKYQQGVEYGKKKGEQAKDYVKNKVASGKKKIKERIASAKRAVNKRLKPQPAGKRIELCPKGKKKQRVKDRKEKIAKTKRRLKKMKPGKKKKALEHAVKRFELNNVAVERARLADNVYKVGEGHPPEGWDRVSPKELKELGMTLDHFPQMGKNFRPSEYKDGYFPELYKSKKDVFGEERYVLVFRGTQGQTDWLENGKQAFGIESGHYTRAMETAQALKKGLEEKGLEDMLDITGHSLGGGMATAAGIVTGSPTYTVNPAGVHPGTVERFGKKFGKEYSRRMAKTNVHDFIAKGEALDTAQSPLVQRSVIVGAGALSPKGAMLALAGNRAFREEGVLTYGASGVRHEISILSNAKDVADGNTGNGMTPGVKERLNFVNKVDYHDATYVVAGIEQQKADDQYVLDRMVR